MKTMYTKDGKKVRVIQDLNTDFVVQEIFVDKKGNEVVRGDHSIVQELFFEPPEQPLSLKEKQHNEELKVLNTSRRVNMNNLIDHAKREFIAVGYKPADQEEDGPNKWIQENVLELLQVFSDQAHSGSSAPYCIKMFSKLAMFEPLGPLTGEDNEWIEVGTHVWQNIRCSHVFKEADGIAYDIQGKVFCEPNGACYTSRESRVPVTFPYTPKTEYVDVKS